MATTIKLKNSVTTTNAPSSLAQGEVAINVTDKKVWVGNAATTPVQLLGTGSSATFTDLTVVNGASIQGLTVGRGAGAVSSNTAVGTSALLSNTSGASNSAFGTGALSSNTTGGTNSTFGQQSLGSNSTGSSNSAFGYQALVNNTTASNNTAVGYQSAYSNTTGNQIVAIGRASLYANTTGTEHTVVGHGSLAANTTGSFNSAVGNGALSSNTTGGYNTALGHSSLISNTTASNNTAVGYQAGYSNTTGANSVYLGIGAGRLNTTGNDNCMAGYYAGESTTGGGNTFFGGIAGNAVTTGTKNTIIGRYNGDQGGLDIRTASNYIVLSDGDGNPRGIFDGSGNLRVGATSLFSGGEKLLVTNTAADWASIFRSNTGNSATTYGVLINFATTPNGTANWFLRAQDSTAVRCDIRSNGGIANFSANNVNLSDAREKNNVELAGSYLDKICAIPVKTFNYIDQNLEEDGGLNLGVIAQDVQAVAPELVLESNWAGKDEPEKMRLSIYQTDLQYALMKCIQEQQAIITDLKSRIEALESK
jgi:hypothetical protein